MTVAGPTAFLDRDGTIIEERHYLGDPEGVVLLPRAAEGLRLLARLGYALVVVSNQSGVGRGLITAEQVEAVNRRIAALLDAEGVEIGAWYMCPHAPDVACDCRKPLPGMIDQALRDQPIDLGRSVVIGDKDADLGLATSRGVPGFLVLTGYGVRHAEAARAAGHGVFDDLYAVAVHLAAGSSSDVGGSGVPAPAATA